ncbi:dihydrodipicolinate synthase family protein [Thaumasiovibrio subtropicus]|uniref:dihydrodipicolinate synthase family protein n=1 Tax=Thaumasiovibrio subtropicus TaxID=1891207 RepID=UPI000B354C5D|nr:dihydrodipicolinate synthase family protein [Thaumasiovibrio subtropicus]
MFHGLTTYPITPMDESGIDFIAYSRLIHRLVEAGVDGIGALGSTGNAVYLSIEERKRVAIEAVKQAGVTPVIVGISALRTRDVLKLAEDAQYAGAKALLLAPMSYQKLSEEEVYHLYEKVSAHVSVPLCVYDNPATTNFTFSDMLLGEIAKFNPVKAIKLPPVQLQPSLAEARIRLLRNHLPKDVAIGISGDASAATALNAGCDGWHSVIGGIFPETTKNIFNASKEGDKLLAKNLSDKLQPLWDLCLYNRGSLRVFATAAELLGLVRAPYLPSPLKPLPADAKMQLAKVLKSLPLK